MKKLLIFNFNHIYNLQSKIKTITIMIQNIVRHCARNVYQHNVNLLISFNLTNNNKSYFSTQNTQQTQPKQQKKPRQPKQKQTSDFSPIDYYRNTIRRVNIRSNGRGKFTPYSLQKIVDMSSTQEHAKVMYEAYYNYMGHFTLIPNKVVDELIYKSITIGNQVEQILQIFGNHNYLAYFPHYDATNRFIKHLVKINDNENLQKMLRTLIRSPLIKINSKIVDNLVQIGSNPQTEPNIKEYALKVLVYRAKLVDGMSQVQVLQKIANMLESAEIGPFEAKPKIRECIENLLAQTSANHEQNLNRLILLSTYGMIEDCVSIITQDQQQINTQYDRFFDYLIKLAPRTGQEVNFGTALKEALSEAKLSIGATQKLEQIVKAKQPAEQEQNQ